MRLFTRIVELGNFTRAAEQLGMNRAVATQGIKELEAHLGVRLLARTTRQVTATVDGDAYYQHCVRILADLDEAEAEFSQVTGSPRGRVRVDVSAAMCRNVLLPALPDLAARFPLLRVEISTSDRQIDLIREGVDCVLRLGALRDVPMVARRLARLQQVTCASAAYLARHGTPQTLAELEAHHAVDYFSASGKFIPLEFTADGQVLTRRLAGSVAVNNSDAYIAACLAGLGLIQVPARYVAGQLAQGRLVEVLPAHRPPALPLHVLYPPGRSLPARVRAFIEWLELLFRDAA